VKHQIVGVPGKTTLACLGVASIAFLLLAASGHRQMGGAAAIGTVVGSFNGFMTRHGVHTALQGGAGFGTTSLFRLGILTAVGLGIGLLLGPSLLPFVIGGVALAQLVLAAVSALEVSRV
jgi:hypothetical protein